MFLILIYYFIWILHDFLRLSMLILFFSRKFILILTLKRLGGQSDTTLWFSKNASSKERAKPWFFVTFNIIISHIFPENFIEITVVVQKIWRISLSILAVHGFSSIFWISWHFRVTKKLIEYAYNRWCQHFFSFNIL